RARRAVLAPRRVRRDRPAAPSDDPARAAAPSRGGCAGRVLQKSALLVRRQPLSAPWGGEGETAVDHRGLNGPFLVQRGDVVLAVAEPVEDLVGVLAEEWRALHLDRRVGELDRRADLHITAARRMVDLDQEAALVERPVLVNVLHR